MENKHRIEITTRDRLLRAWENSMALVREFEDCANEIEDDRQASAVFAEFAEDEGMHAARFKDMLHEYQHQEQG